MCKRILYFALVAFICWTPLEAASGYKVISWNDLGMHCTDGVDYSVFGVLPPYNTANSQLIDPTGHLVRNPFGITLTYQSIVDPSGSINTSSIGKTNFWSYTQDLFGVTLAPDA